MAAVAPGTRRLRPFVIARRARWQARVRETQSRKSVFFELRLL
jgi:hypothetical protein